MSTEQIPILPKVHGQMNKSMQDAASLQEPLVAFSLSLPATSFRRPVRSSGPRPNFPRRRPLGLAVGGSVRAHGGTGACARGVGCSCGCMVPPDPLSHFAGGSPISRSAVGGWLRAALLGGSAFLCCRVSRDACLCLLRVRDYEYELCVFWAG